MPVSVNVGGSWKDAVPYVKVGSSWKPSSEVFTKVNGVWETAFSGGGNKLPKFLEANTKSGVTNSSTFSVQPSGKILILGQGGSSSLYWLNVNGTAYPGGVLRLNSDYSIDQDFMSNVGAGFNGYAIHNHTNSSNKTVIAGNFSSFNNITVPSLVVLNSDGSLDTTFNTNANAALASYLPNFYIQSVTINNSGEVFIAYFNANTEARVLKLNSNGTFSAVSQAFLYIYNNSYSYQNCYYDYYYNYICNTVTVNEFYKQSFNIQLVQKSNGGVYVFGGFNSYSQNWNGINTAPSGGYRPIGVVAFTSSLSIDSTYSLNQQSGSDYNTFFETQNIVLDSSDTMFMVGRGHFGGTYYDRMMFKIFSNGSMDTSYVNNSPNISPSGRLALDSSGRAVVITNTALIDGSRAVGIWRINTNGTLDSSINANVGDGFTADGYGGYSPARIQITSDQSILVYMPNAFAYKNNVIANIVKLNSDFTYDTNWAYNANGIAGRIDAIAYDTNGKILIGGNFTSIFGTTKNRIARLNSDGSIDSTFLGTGFGVPVTGGPYITKLAVQPDGKILVSGGFQTYSGTAAKGITRLNSDGTLDTTFNNNVMASGGVLANRVVSDFTLDPDGKITFVFLTTGSTFQGTGGGGFRLNSNGTRDTSFIIPQFNNGIRSIDRQSTGKYILGGDFTNRVARVTSTGSVDTFGSSQGGGANSRIHRVKVMPNDKVLIGGDLTAYNGTSTRPITLLNSDGSLDTSFNSSIMGYPFYGTCTSIQVTSRGTIVAFGTLTYNGYEFMYKVLEINADGTVVQEFNRNFIGIPANNMFASFTPAMSEERDKSILIGGTFVVVNGAPSSRIAKISTDRSS